MYDVGDEVWYAVWTPATGGGFTTDYEWKIEGADAGGVLLVDGNRVHCVVQDSTYHTYEYIQYDLQGNTVVPLIDFTRDDIFACGRFPELNLDTQGNLMVVQIIDDRYVLWKVDKLNGATLIDEKVVTSYSPNVYFIVRRIPATDQYYLCWCDGTTLDMIYNLVMDEDGNVIIDWHVAYDYSDEDPEDVREIHGVVDDQGNLYIVYSQGEIEPVFGRFPTFGWFDHTYLSVEEETVPVPIPPSDLTLSVNPVRAGVVFSVTGNYSGELVIFDLTGREVAGVTLSDGIGWWDGSDYSDSRLPAGVYTVRNHDGLIRQFTLLDR
jgi:hypothetical protein